jgi:hypothetical protein
MKDFQVGLDELNPLLLPEWNRETILEHEQCHRLDC